MPPDPTKPESIDELVEQCAERVRRGESVSVEEYAAAYPDLADDIRELFPAMLAMEQLKVARQKEIPGSRVSDEMGWQTLGPLKRLGEFRIIRELGRGGMGAVYLAEDTNLGRPCALKVLRKELSGNHEFLTRFRREAVATGKLNHPNIVMAYKVDEERDVHYYAMEFCEGLPLDAALLQLGTVPCAIALEVIAQVAKGLQHAHTHGVIHRDIKPSNILICQPPRSKTTLPVGQNGGDVSKGIRNPKDCFPDGYMAKILDLGLSKTITGDANSSFLTQTGATMGTPHYISPEQADGARSIDGRTDIYSLGATCYHLVTGQTPYTGRFPAAIIMKHLEGQLRDPRELNPGIPDGMARVIQRMMAKKPENRYATCADLVEDLERLAEGHAPASWQPEATKPILAETIAATVAIPDESPAPQTPTALELQPPDIWRPAQEHATPPAAKTAAPPLDRRIVWTGIAAATLLFATLAVWALMPNTSGPEDNGGRVSNRPSAKTPEVKPEPVAEKVETPPVDHQGNPPAESQRNLELERRIAETERLLDKTQRELDAAKRQAERQPLVPILDVPEKPVEKPEGPAVVPPEKMAVDDKPQGPMVLAALERWIDHLPLDQYATVPSELPQLNRVQDVEGLKRLHLDLARKALEVQDAEQRARNNEIAARNRIAAVQRRLNNPKKPPMPKPPPKRPPHGRPPPMHKPQPFDDRLRRERERDQQELEELRAQQIEARAQMDRIGQTFKTLLDVKEAVADRLAALGVDDISGASAGKKKIPYKIYVLNDGTELKAKTVVEMGDQIAIKDENGNIRTIQKSSIKSVRNGP